MGNALVIAVALAIMMYHAISRLQDENLKLKERIYRLRRSGRRHSPKDEDYWRAVEPSDLVDRINDRDSTILN